MTATTTPPASETAAPEQPDGTPRTLPAPSVRLVVGSAVMVVFAGGGIWSVINLDIGIAALVRSADNAVHFLSRTVPLDFPPAGQLLAMTGRTLAIVICATVMAVVLSTAAALLAARPTCRSAPVRGAARAFIVLMRAMPELVLAILFIRMFGLGAIAGVLALGLHSIGMIGRMVADAIEDADDGPRRALESSGASRAQQIFGATLPGIFPAMVAHGLHRFDINLRASVILGWVGVGGIGMELSHALSTMNYPRGIALALVVLGLCIVTEVISGALRMRLLGRSAQRRTPWFGWVPGRRSMAAAGGRALGAITTPPWNGERIARSTWMIVTAALVAGSVWYTDIDWGRVVAGIPSIPDVVAQFLPPDDGGILDRLLAQLWVTVQIALAATFLGALLALPVGVLAARNVAPNATVAQCFRTIIVVTRGIPELILAIVFVVISGMGAVAGTLALAIGAMGLLSKLVADSIEETDVRVQQAVTAGGATPRQVFVAATLRQAAPAVVAHIFYQLDVNFRSATLLGIVGAGGDRLLPAERRTRPAVRGHHADPVHGRRRGPGARGHCDPHASHRPVEDGPASRCSRARQC